MTGQLGLQSERGMTLIELMIALTIFGVIISSVLGVLRHQSEGFRLGNERMDALQNLRFAGNMIEQDLRMAGANTSDNQPFLVHVDNDVLAFNVDYATNLPNDPWAVYFDPDAPTGSVMALTKAQQITIPRSSFQYPDTNYAARGGFGNSAAETLMFFFDPDSSTMRSDDYALYRKVNRDAAQLIARNLLRTGTTPFFQYSRLAPQGSANAIMDVPNNTLPLSHAIPIHGTTTDIGQSAIMDSVHGVTINFATTNGRSGAEERIRSVSRVVRLAIAGTRIKRTCGDKPLFSSALAAVPGTAGGFPYVRLQWLPSVDEAAGENDVSRYVVWRKNFGAVDWDDPYLSVPAGAPLYTYQDDAVTSGDALVYAVAAQDCTPSLSVLVESGRVDVP